MPVITVCPECSAKMKVSDNAVGKQIKCPKCSQPFTVAASTATAAAAKPQAAAVVPDAKPQVAAVAPTPIAPDPLEQLGGMESEAEREKPADDPDDVAPRRPKPRRQQPMDFMALLNYQAFITPTFGIHVVFVLGAVSFLYTGWKMTWLGINAFNIDAGGASILTLLGLVQMIGGPIMVRVGCETIMAIFRILETLKEK